MSFIHFCLLGVLVNIFTFLTILIIESFQGKRFTLNDLFSIIGMLFLPYCGVLVLLHFIKITDFSDIVILNGIKKEDNTQLKEQLEEANNIIKHLIYSYDDSGDLAYEYLKKYNLLQDKKND